MHHDIDRPPQRSESRTGVSDAAVLDGGVGICLTLATFGAWPSIQSTYFYINCMEDKIRSYQLAVKWQYMSSRDTVTSVL